MFTDLFSPGQAKQFIKLSEKTCLMGNGGFLEIRIVTQAIKLDQWVLQQNNFDNPPFHTPETFGNI